MWNFLAVGLGSGVRLARAGDGGAVFYPTVEAIWSLHAADADQRGNAFFLRLLSRSIALQRNFSTGSLTVLTRRDVQSGNENKGLRGWEMTEWE